MLLIVLYHFLEVNGLDTPDNPLTTTTSAVGATADGNTTNKAAAGVGGLEGEGGTPGGKKGKGVGRGGGFGRS